MYHLDDVFVTGGVPTVTYVSRNEAGLEARVERYLASGNKVLAVSGRSKSGKSVLVRRVLTQTQTSVIQLTGASLDSMATFWTNVAHQIGLPVIVERSEEESSEVTGELAGKVGGGVLPGELSSTVSSKASDKTTIRQSAAIALSESVKEVLRARHSCLVLDDFHFAPEAVRTTLAREIKDMIFNGIRVIVVAAPERVLDLLQSEVELTGRVTRIRVADWEPVELMRIATQGHEALNVVDPGGAIADVLVERSFGSPLLMQELCSGHCSANGVVHTVEGTAQRLRAPDDWTAFFRNVSSSLRPALVDALQVGPPQRRRRKQLQLKTGGTVDMYSAVLIALGRATPRRRLELSELSDELYTILQERPPLEKIRRTCKKMAEIAQDKRGQGDVALDFSEGPERITVIDPYLAFYLGSGGLSEFELPFTVLSQPFGLGSFIGRGAWNRTFIADPLRSSQDAIARGGFSQSGEIE